VTKITHSPEVARALKNTAKATDKALKGLNRAAAARMSRGDYDAAQALAAKGREVKEFRGALIELQARWKTLSKGNTKQPRAQKEDVTPLWGYYHPLLKSLLAAGGEARWEDIETRFRKDHAFQLLSGDRAIMRRGWERWKWMILRARKPLKEEGWVALTRKKSWKITDAGRRSVETGLSTK
jgi:hypothetical protein